MGFNPDGTPDDGGNFTTPGTVGPGDKPARPMGTGDHGEEWIVGPDGKGKWGPPQAPRLPDPRQGNGGYADGVNYNPRTGIADFGPGATGGQVKDPTAWGGTSGAVVMGPDGKPMVDASQSGRAKDVARLRGLGEGYDARKAYQLDYTKGDADRQQANYTRGEQLNAVNMLGNAAKGGAPSAAVIQGQGGLDDAFGAQLGAQAELEADRSLARQPRSAALSRTPQARRALQTILDSSAPPSCTSDRTAYSGSAGALRTGDLQGQSLDQARAKAKYESEIGQRKLNDRGQRISEDLAYDVNVNSMNAGLKNDDLAAGNTVSSMQRETEKADKLAAFYNSAINEAGKYGKGAL